MTLDMRFKRGDRVKVVRVVGQNETYRRLLGGVGEVVRSRGDTEIFYAVRMQNIGRLDGNTVYTLFEKELELTITQEIINAVLLR